MNVLFYSYRMPFLWRAFVGLTALSNRYASTVQEREVLKIHRHEKYSGVPLFDYDVALFQVCLSRYREGSLHQNT